jgi:hypothetical protein
MEKPAVNGPAGWPARHRFEAKLVLSFSHSSFLSPFDVRYTMAVKFFNHGSRRGGTDGHGLGTGILQEEAELAEQPSPGCGSPRGTDFYANYAKGYEFLTTNPAAAGPKNTNSQTGITEETRQTHVADHDDLERLPRGL